MAKAVRSGRETGVYNCKHSSLDTLEEIIDDDHGIISIAWILMIEKLIFAPSPIWTLFLEA
jgi:hypothetical protein